jgi:RNA 2',3'-cyclic 3'-phosphodiesterase
MKRIFIAIKIDPGEELLKMISSLKTGLKNESIKWTETSNIHITLVFLGDTEEKRIKEIDVILSGICSGFGGFDLILRGAGIFRSLRDPRIIWTGINNSKELSDLNNVISVKLRETGTYLEERPFSPHLTIGRIKRLIDTTELSALIENYKDKEIQRIRVSEIVLFESVLRPQGPVYTPLGRYSL